MLERVCRKGHSCMLLEKCELTQAIVEVSEKSEIEPPLTMIITLVDRCSEETKTFSCRHGYTAWFIVALFTITKKRNQPKCLSTNVWTKETRCIYTIGYYSAAKKKKKKLKSCHFQ